MSKELKPCPLCSENSSIVSCYQNIADNWTVSCGACGCSSGTSKSRDNVVDHWNTRPDNALIDTLVEALEFLLAANKEWAKTYELAWPNNAEHLAEQALAEAKKWRGE